MEAVEAIEYLQVILWLFVSLKDHSVCFCAAISLFAGYQKCRF